MLTSSSVVVKGKEVELRILCGADAFVAGPVFVLLNVILIKLLVVNNGLDDELYMLLEETLMLFKKLVVVLFFVVINPDKMGDVVFLNPLEEVTLGTVQEFDLIWEVVLKFLVPPIVSLEKGWLEFPFVEPVILLYIVKVADETLVYFEEKIALIEEVFHFIKLDEVETDFSFRDAIEVVIKCEILCVVDIVFPNIELFKLLVLVLILLLSAVLLLLIIVINDVTLEGLIRLLCVLVCELGWDGIDLGGCEISEIVLRTMDDMLFHDALEVSLTINV